VRGGIGHHPAAVPTAARVGADRPSRVDLPLRHGQRGHHLVHPFRCDDRLQAWSRVTYEPLLTGASLLVAILGSASAFAIGASSRRWMAPLGGVAFAATVSAMHYTGMAAFTVDAAVHWSPAYLASSVAAAIVFGALAFQRASLGRSDHDAPTLQAVPCWCWASSPCISRAWRP